ncbi:microfibril-associated glycoprotein 4-like [Musca vetustissima]|uniref:microfibril-associated glycoprotein 4-like n=1 Tax=Musca vetustissima TaxID=27455 RepID=UPI002AB6FB31|nr:microfibril-associated glycoprotein 4-like [Musca vetustissima]
MEYTVNEITGQSTCTESGRYSTTPDDDNTTTSDNDTTTTAKYSNPDEDEFLLMLWKNLFQKVNTLLAETKKINGEADKMSSEITNMNREINKLNNNLVDVNQKIDGLTKRQEEQKKNVEKILKQISPMNVTLRDEENLKTLQHWTTILRRIDGSVNFYRNWRGYKVGFGNPPHGEFFIGLDKLHELTTAVPNIELKVILRDWNGEERYALYDGFRIGNEAEQYEMKVLGKYRGTAGDSLEYHKGRKFSTFDEENDIDITNCAQSANGAWWFGACYFSHLFGPYRSGIHWWHWKNAYYSFKNAEMLIRAKSE